MKRSFWSVLGLSLINSALKGHRNSFRQSQRKWDNDFDRANLFNDYEDLSDPIYDDLLDDDDDDDLFDDDDDLFDDDDDLLDDDDDLLDGDDDLLDNDEDE